MCLLLSLRLSATQKVQELPRKLAPLTCTSGSLSSRGHGSLPLQNGCVADGAPPAAVLLCSVHSLLHCFLLRHRMENMCHLNIEQFRGPKSQLQNTKNKKKNKGKSSNTAAFALNVPLPVLTSVVRKEMVCEKKQITTQNTKKSTIV